MIIEYKEWLPDNAITDGVIEKNLSKPLKGWRDKWFRHGQDIQIEAYHGESVCVGNSDLSAWHNEGFILGIDVAGREALALKAMGIGHDNLSVNGNDKQVLELLSEKILSDLRRSLCETYSLNNDFVEEAGERAAVALVKAPLKLKVIFREPSFEMYLSLHYSLAVALRKINLLEPISIIAQGGITEAINTQSLKVGARAGKCSVSLVEAESLSVGDVVVLDKNLADMFEVTINNNIIESLSCRIKQSGSDEKLKITHIEVD